MRAWAVAWRGLLLSMAPTCGCCGGVHAGSLWRRMSGRGGGVRMRGSRYCRAECLELAVAEVLSRMRPEGRTATRTAHRIPLGLLLLSRQQLTAEQLRAALAAQREAGHGKLGAWLRALGYVSEQQLTAALARQWSCPLLRSREANIASSRTSSIPALLLESFQMIPVEMVEATRTLLIAFSEGLDYGVLYAIEQMLGYRTEACLVCPSILQKSLRALVRQRESSDIVFDRTEDIGECARIIVNYCAKVRAEQVKLVRCGDYLWIRLERPREDAVNLLLRAPQESAGPMAVASAVADACAG